MRAWITFAVVSACAIVSLMGTDLVLPSIPDLPQALGGSLASAQFVLAAYVGGISIGLLIFGYLSVRYSTRQLFVTAMLGMAVTSLLCSLSSDFKELLLWRAFQGVFAAGPAALAPAVIKALFDEARAMRALGLLSSLESLAPALAPILGAYLLVIGGWQLSFEVIAIISSAMAASLIFAVNLPQTSRASQGSYSSLVRDATFLRYALSQALVLGGLFTFIFAMPTVLVHALGGTIEDFIVLQVVGISGFIIAANLSGKLAAYWGAENLIYLGTGLAVLGAGGQLFYALMGGNSTATITALFLPVNIGLGLRGPPGFYRAIVAAKGDDSRGSALVVLAVFASAALGTTLAAPLLEYGTIHVAGITFLMHAIGLFLLASLPRLREADLSKQ